MTRKERIELANKIYEMSKDEFNKENNISERELEELIKGCSILDLLEIDEIVSEKISKNAWQIKKFLI